MSLYNYRNATAEVKESAGLIAEVEEIIKGHILAMLREGLRMGISTTRRDLRDSIALFVTPVPKEDTNYEARVQMWENVEEDVTSEAFERVVAADWPRFCIADDDEELGLGEAREDFKQVDKLLLKPEDGPILISLRLSSIQDDGTAGINDLSCELALTIFWENGQETPLLVKALRLSLDQLRELLVPDYDTSHLVNSHQLLEQALKAIKMGSGLSIDTVVIEECSVMSLLCPGVPIVYTGKLDRGDVAGLRLRLIVDVSDGVKYHIGYDINVKVGREPKTFSPVSLAVDKYRTESRGMFIMSSCHINLPTVNARFRNLYHDPNLLDPAGYKGAYGKGKEIRDRIAEADVKLEDIFEKKMGLSRTMTALLLLHSTGYTSLASGHFLSIFNHTMGRLFPRVASINQFQKNLTEGKGRYVFSKRSMISFKKTQLTGFSRRTGEWDETIDGPALEQTMYRLCDVYDCFTAELCDMIVYGCPAVAPAKFEVDGQSFFRRDQEPKRPLATLLFGMMSGRMTPWDVRDMVKRPYDLLETRVEGMIRSHLTPFLGDKKVEKIRIGTWKHRSVAQDVLNTAARSQDPPFATLGLGNDDWNGWLRFYARDGHRGKATTGYDKTKRSIYTAIHLALQKAFPNSPPFTRARSVEIVYDVLDHAISLQALKSLGRWHKGGESMQHSDIFSIAGLMYCLRITPDSTDYDDYQLPAEYNNILRHVLPHLSVRMDGKLLRHKQSIVIAYNTIDAKVHQQGFATVFATLFSPDVAETIRRFRDREDAP